MTRRTLLSAMCAILVMSSAQAVAQTGESGTIAGVVRDTSGAVLPGVTVEASSPALIEKVRTAVTDSAGLYRIVDLRPGVYTVNFSLTGFATLTRQGLELTTGFTAAVNAELRVGAIEENHHGDRREPCRRRAEHAHPAGADERRARRLALQQDVRGIRRDDPRTDERRPVRARRGRHAG